MYCCCLLTLVLPILKHIHFNDKGFLTYKKDLVQDILCYLGKCTFVCLAVCILASVHESQHEHY